MALLPPVGNAYDNPGLLEYGDLPQEGVSLHGCPRLGLEEGSALELLSGPSRGFRGLADGFEQRLEGTDAAGPGKLLQSAAEGQVHRSVGRGDPVGEGRHERERSGFRAFVFGEMKGHPTQQLHGGIDAVEPLPEPSCRGGFGPGQRFELSPQTRKQFGR